jgi:flagellar assembly protein FliH
VIPSTSARSSQPRLAHARPGWGPATTAAFRSVTELEAAADDDELESRLGDLDRARLDDMARQGYLDGHDQGVKTGYDAGYAQAVAEVSARFSGAVDALDAAARQLAQADAVTLAELDEQATALALNVAQAVIGRELAAAADPGADALARALAFAPDRGDLVARLHPGDVAALGAIDGLLPGREVAIVADAGVEPGGCIIEIGACTIDAQIEPAFERVRALGVQATEARP